MSDQKNETHNFYPPPCEADRQRWARPKDLSGEFHDALMNDRGIAAHDLGTFHSMQGKISSPPSGKNSG